jgi:hypothetical protein
MNLQAIGAFVVASAIGIMAAAIALRAGLSDHAQGYWAGAAQMVSFVILAMKERH